MTKCVHNNNPETCAVRPTAEPCNVVAASNLISTFAQYSEALTAARTRQYPLCGENLVYPVLGIVGEAGELADKVKKLWRNKFNELQQQTIEGSRTHVEVDQAVMTMTTTFIDDKLRQELVKEMGDILWYLWAFAEELGVTLDYVARTNVAKISDRAKRGVVCSQGDNR